MWSLSHYTRGRVGLEEVDDSVDAWLSNDTICKYLLGETTP
jgi:hypothetical protein